MWMIRGRDFGKDNPGVQVDFPKMHRAGIGGSFFALYVPAYMNNRDAAVYAKSMLDELKRQVACNKSSVAFATDKVSFEVNISKSLVSIFIGIENGTPLLGERGMLEYFYREGVRYVTLCHSADNDICDSCTGEGKWGGLSPLGKELVEEMNALGMVIDVAHSAGSTVRDVLGVSAKPIAYTHGCCSSLCSHKRNLPDDLIRGIASRGGVVCMSIFPSFLTDGFAGFNDDNPDGREMPDMDLVVDHIVHAVNVAGIEGVGIGTDFEGINHTPKGLENIEKMPVLMDALSRKGFSSSDLDKMASENLLRVISSQK
jgi:membrane dipeptidase